MKRFVFATLALILLSSCGALYVSPGPAHDRGSVYRRSSPRNYHPPRNAVSHIVFVKDSYRYSRVTIVVDDRISFTMNNSPRNRPPRVRELRVKPGGHNIKVYYNGRLLYQRWVVAPPNRKVRVSV